MPQWPMNDHEKRYQWDYASDWLVEKINTSSLQELRAMVFAILSQLTEDDLQEVFQSEMDADGFFDEVTR
ncbi:hypothetical protein LCGC14_1498210 [marine sediment metagenome]|uniref:Uncharacterized protein n=1 Tax=marine sediment metagenome TaxID=412755 RepID=A0A0F9M686_9ZZZZ